MTAPEFIGSRQLRSFVRRVNAPIDGRVFLWRGGVLILGFLTAGTIWQALDPSIPLWLRLSLSILGGIAFIASISLFVAPRDAIPSTNSTVVVKRLTPSRRATIAACCLGIGTAVILALVPGGLQLLRICLAAILLLAPGSLLSLLLLPQRVGLLGRIAFSWAFSVGLIPIPLEMLNHLGIPFSVWTAVLTLVFETLVLGSVVILRNTGRLKRIRLSLHSDRDVSA